MGVSNFVSVATLVVICYIGYFSTALRLTRINNPSLLSAYLDFSSVAAELKAAIKVKIRLSKLIINNSCDGYARDTDNYMVCCPFHEDSTPSLSISDSLGLYHCFSCGAKGDVFQYIKEHHKVQYNQSISFKESLYRAVQVVVDQNPIVISKAESYL